MKTLFSIFILLISFRSFAQTTGSKWKVQYVSEGEMMTKASAKKSEIIISIADKKLTGTFGCNSFSGNLEYTKGDHIKPIKLANTKDKCPEVQEKLDKSFLDALKSANKLVIDRDKAKFYKGTKLILELNR